MKTNQDINALYAGNYTQIVAPVYTDNTNRALDPNLASYTITWRLIGLTELVTKTTADGGIMVNAPTAGWIMITIEGEDTTGLRNGIYTHIAQAIDGDGHTRILFEGTATLVGI